MRELELTRAADDRRRYVLDGVGALAFGGWFSRTATAEAGGRSWSITRRGVLRRVVEMTDDAGMVAGTFRANSLRRGGTVRWEDRELELRAASAWRERYALTDGDRELALLDGKGWGKRPVKISVGEPDAVSAPLLLLAAFVVRGLADDAGAAAGGTAAAVGTFA